MAKKRYSGHLPKRPVTVKISISPRHVQIRGGGLTAEATRVGGSHKEIVEQAVADAMGGFIPYGCQIKYNKLKRLPGRKAGADIEVVCPIATVYTVAQRNPKTGTRRFNPKKRK